jgi:rare lipoprotein A
VKEKMRTTDSTVTFLLVLVGVIAAGILFYKVAGPSWLARQFSNRGIITGALVGVVGVFAGYPFAGFLSLGVDPRGMIMKLALLAGVLLQAALLGPASAANGKPGECGLASFYSNVSNETASGEDTLAEDYTAAHRTLPFATLVHVENQINRRWTVVRITDRGPTIGGRVIDLSQIAARALDISGVAQVCLSVIWTPESRAIGEK